MRCRICECKSGPGVLFADHTPEGPLCSDCAEFRELLTDFLTETPLDEPKMLKLYRESRIAVRTSAADSRAATTGKTIN
jgi:hypothetical protein